jgi:hypothetical protein
LTSSVLWSPIDLLSNLVSYWPPQYSGLLLTSSVLWPPSNIYITLVFYWPPQYSGLLVTWGLPHISSLSITSPGSRPCLVNCNDLTIGFCYVLFNSR